MQVTHHAGVDSLPVWSPDGTRIAFDSPRNGHYQICVVPAGGRHRDGPDRRIRPATCSRPGRPTARRSRLRATARGRSTCTCYTLASGNVRRLTTDSAAEYQPAWSPDGRRILFARATAAGPDDRRDAGRGRPGHGADGRARQRDPAAGSRSRPIAVTGRLTGTGRRRRAARACTITGRNFAAGATVGSGRPRRRASSSSRPPRSRPRAPPARARSTSSSRRRADRRPSRRPTGSPTSRRRDAAAGRRTRSPRRPGRRHGRPSRRRRRGTSPARRP